MTELIIAIDKNNGIGLNNKLPWNCKQELQIFKQKTTNNVLIVGRKTFNSLPKLNNRKIYCLTRDLESTTNSKNNDVTFIDNFCKIPYIKDKTIFIAGGKQIYEHSLSIPYYIKKVHLSVMKKSYNCDCFFNKELLDNFVILEKQTFEEFTHYILEPTTSCFGERQYLNLLKNIVFNGNTRQTRNGTTLSKFNNHVTFDLSNRVLPMLTTKRMFLRGIVEELLFFIRGDTDTKKLMNKDVNIWKLNTTREFLDSQNLNYDTGVMGPMYGYQWRHFGHPYITDQQGNPIKVNDSDGVDQIKDVINLIKNDPMSRRILLTTYNPTQSREGVLYPCHSVIIQFYVEGESLDMFCYNRSQDTFLGTPFNITSSSLLLIMIAQITNKKPRFFNLSMGDTHIYDIHIEHAKKQLARIPYKFPTITINNLQTLQDIDNLSYQDFVVENYKYHPGIKTQMVA
jgi:dihydrofolate reductase/thymidylate synthase